MAARRRDVAVVALEGAGQHPELVSGRWPRGGGAPETALNEVLAAEPGVRAGGSFTVRAADRKRLRVRTGGLYRIGDRSPALWTSVASPFGTPDTIALVPREVIRDGAGLSPGCERAVARGAGRRARPRTGRACWSPCSSGCCCPR
ncbi:hypothetical protein ACFC18_17085 [Streptomyces sp. NPDC056121]|uniref:hypothetical protein n=1 Tax=unclassified Streptomyces TaxID=2593676 RepID=UPI0033E0611E